MLSAREWRMGKLEEGKEMEGTKNQEVILPACLHQTRGDYQTQRKGESRICGN